MGFAHRQHRRKGFDVDEFLGPCGGAACGIAGAGNHGKDRLAQELHHPVGQDRVVVHDRAALVFAGDVFGGNHVHHAGQRAQRVQTDALEPAVRHRGQTQRRMQRAGQFGQVVDVGGAAGHVQVGRLVRMVAADHGSVRGRLGEGGVGDLVHASSLLRQAVDVAHTLACAKGACVRVSSHSRLSKPRATWRR